MKKKLPISICLIIITIASLYGFFYLLSEPHFVIKTGDGEELLHFPTADNQLESHNPQKNTLILKYTHSITGGTVKSFLTASGNGVTVIKEQFEKFGPGLEDVSSPDVDIDADGLITVTLDGRTKDHMVVRAGEIADQKFIHEGEVIRLLDYVNPGEQVIITVKRKIEGLL